MTKPATFGMVILDFFDVFDWPTFSRNARPFSAKFCNAYEIGKAGRKRWKTEHSFNRQKKHIFNLEHAYTTDENAMKCYHYFLQIADFIFLFMAYSFTSENENLVYKTFGTLLEFYNEIRESFISEVICLDEISARKQLRLITP